MPSNTIRQTPYSYILAVLYVGVALLQSSPEGPQVINFMSFDAGLVRQGQVWRLLTYVFLFDGSMFWLIFKALACIWFLLPVERHVGSRFFAILYLGATAVASSVATLADLPLSSDYHVSLCLFLIHGLLFPQSIVHLMFIIPIKILTLALISTVVYALSLISGSFLLQISGFSGFAFSLALWWWFYRRKQVVQRVKKMPGAVVRKSRGGRIAQLEERAQEIVIDFRETRALTDDDAEWLEGLEKGVEFDRGEMCSPHSFHPQGDICSTCDGLSLCLKRRTEAQMWDGEGDSSLS